MCSKTILENLSDIYNNLINDSNFNFEGISFYENLVEKCNSIIKVAENRKLIISKKKSQVLELKEYPNLDIYVNFNSENSSSSSSPERPLVIAEKESSGSQQKEAIEFFSKLNLQKSSPCKLNSELKKKKNFDQKIIDSLANNKSITNFDDNVLKKNIFVKNFEDNDQAEVSDNTENEIINEDSEAKIFDYNNKTDFSDEDKNSEIIDELKSKKVIDEVIELSKNNLNENINDIKLEKSVDNRLEHSMKELNECLSNKRSEVSNYEDESSFELKNFTIPLVKLPENILKLAFKDVKKAKKEIKKIDPFYDKNNASDSSDDSIFNVRKRRKTSLSSLSDLENSFSSSDEVIGKINNSAKKSKKKIYNAIYSSDDNSDIENKENDLNFEKKILIDEDNFSEDSFEEFSDSDENSENEDDSDDSSLENEIIEVFSLLNLKKNQKIKIKKEKIFNENENENHFEEKHVGRKKLELRNPIRKKIYNIDELRKETKIENFKEVKRVKRIVEIEKKFNYQFSNFKKQQKVDSVILEFSESNKPLVIINKSLFTYFKDYQIESVKFLYRNIIESLDYFEKTNGQNGNGCILAHSMGLGKTFQIISFLHSIFENVRINRYLKSVLIVTPVNTLVNWSQEFKKWLKDIYLYYKIFDFYSCKSFVEKIEMLKKWNLEGGVLIIGHNMFSSLVLKKQDLEPENFYEIIQKCFLNPGPSIVVVDEGHLMKNARSQLNVALSLIRTKLRIILTGTPLQNNLLEYYTMINFVRPFLLGDYKEFSTNFDAPIKKGQVQGCTPSQVKFMKKRVHVLQKLLSHVVIRKDHKTLEKELTKRHEYVLKIHLSPAQDKLYRNFKETREASQINLSFLKDWHTFKLIYNNALLLKKKAHLYENEKWCKDLFETSSWDNLEFSSKMEVFVEILELCELHNEKLVVFSQSLSLLDSIEEQLKIICHQRRTSNSNKFKHQLWVKGKDFFRIDGSCSVIRRQQDIDSFNNLNNHRSRLFLISIKAGCLGVSLIGSNRCIIFDNSWNPSNDNQAIFRIYRYGQQRPVYIYRFVAYSTWEEKIYSKQVWKESLSYRVVDDKNPERQFSTKELECFYDYNPNPERDCKVHKLPEDIILANVLKKLEKKIISYHEHNSLLENEEQDDLTETEKVIAWNEFESSKNKLPSFNLSFLHKKNIKFNSVISKKINTNNLDNLNPSLDFNNQKTKNLNADFVNAQSNGCFQQNDNLNTNQQENYNLNSCFNLNQNNNLNSNQYYNADSYLYTNTNPTNLNMNSAFKNSYGNPALNNLNTNSNNLNQNLNQTKKPYNCFDVNQNNNTNQNNINSFQAKYNLALQEKMNQYKAIANVKSIVKKIITKRKITTKVDICHMLLFTQNLLEKRAEKFGTNIENSKVMKYELRLIKQLLQNKDILLKLFPEFSEIMNPVFVSDSDFLLQKMNELD